MKQEDGAQAETGLDQYEWIRVPTLAAFRCGRLLNQIEHQLTVLWLHGREEHSNSVLGLPAYISSQIPWRDLELASRGAIADERRRMAFEQTIDAAESDWKTQFQTVWHIRLLEDQNHQIEVDRIRYLREEEGPSLQEIVGRRCQFILGSVREINCSLFDFFVESLDSRNLEFFRLGQHVDRLVYSVPAFAELLQIENQRASDDATLLEIGSPTDGQLAWGTLPDVDQVDGDRSEQHEHQDGRRPRLIPNESALWRLPRQPLPLCSPSDEWWHELACLAVTSGIDPANFRQCREGIEIDLNNVRASIVIIANSIETGICSCSAGVSGTGMATQSRPDEGEPEMPTSIPPNASAGSKFQTPTGATSWNGTRVGLEFNLDLFQVRRVGTDRAVTPKTRMDFNVLKYLAEGGGVFRSRLDLESGWEGFGGGSDGHTSIDSRLSAIRKDLSTLGMKLENKPGIGWRLIEKVEP